MSSYVLSEAADQDIQDIIIGTIQRWGAARAENHILDLHNAFGILAQFPEIGADTMVCTQSETIRRTKPTATRNKTTSLKSRT
jgi:plasmid stabilization system protein ParE